jgi:hypothetical protein
MGIFKFLGSWLLAGGVLALINDLTRGLPAGARFTFLSMRGLWQLCHEASLAATQGALQRGIHPLAWDPVMTGVLKLPAWFLLGGLGLVLWLIGRRRRRVELYTN